MKILEGIELVGSVKGFVVLAMAALDLAVVPRRIGSDTLMPNAQVCESLIEQGGTIRFGGIHRIGEFGTVVCLDTFNAKRELLHAMTDKNRRRIGIMVFECFQVTKAESG